MVHDRQTMTHLHNVLLIKLIWICWGIAALVNLAIDIRLLTPLFPFPISFVCAAVLSWLVWRKRRVELVKWLIAVVALLFFFYFICQYPTVYNFSYLWVALVLLGVYQDSRLIVAGGAAVVVFIQFLYQLQQTALFAHSDWAHVWNSLAAVFITVLMIGSSRFSEKLREEAEANETGARQALEITQQYLDTFLQNTPDAACITNLTGEVIQINQAFSELYGWTAEDIVRQPPRAIIPEDVWDETQHVWRRVVTGEKIKGWETVRLTREGERIDVNISMFPIRNMEGMVFARACMARDITERKKTEELLRNSEKLAAIGQLAAGVAHEIRNPLTTIVGFVQLLQRKDKEHPEYYRIILSEMERINFITNEFLVMSKPHVVNHQVKPLAGLLQDVIAFLVPQAIMQQVELRAEGKATCLVQCDVNQLKQVFVNVIKNGIEAMPKGGCLTIRPECSEEGWIKIHFTDQGSGISPEKLARLGEPFFTTKEKGTGLGIVVSKRILDTHQGRMDFHSEPGQGTTVTITLPRYQGEMPEFSENQK